MCCSLILQFVLYSSSELFYTNSISFLNLQNYMKYSLIIISNRRWHSPALWWHFHSSSSWLSSSCLCWSLCHPAVELSAWRKKVFGHSPDKEWRHVVHLSHGARITLQPLPALWSWWWWWFVLLYETFFVSCIWWFTHYPILLRRDWQEMAFIYFCRCLLTCAKAHMIKREKLFKTDCDCFCP